MEIDVRVIRIGKYGMAVTNNSFYLAQPMGRSIVYSSALSRHRRRPWRAIAGALALKIGARSTGFSFLAREASATPAAVSALASERSSGVQPKPLLSGDRTPSINAA